MQALLLQVRELASRVWWMTEIVDLRVRGETVPGMLAASTADGGNADAGTSDAGTVGTGAEREWGGPRQRAAASAATALERLASERPWEEQLAPYLTADEDGREACTATPGGGGERVDLSAWALAHQCTWCSEVGRMRCQCAIAPEIPSRHQRSHGASRHRRRSSVLSEEYDAAQV